MSASTLPPRFTFGPPDTLGNAIFYRYYPYQATLARWDRTSAEAAANPYTIRLQMLQQQLETERAELMQMMRVLSAGATPMELRQEAETRAALARAGRRGGGGGGGRGGPMDELRALDIASGIVSEAGGTVLRAPGMNLRAGVGGLQAPSNAVVRFNAEAERTLAAADPARRAAMAAALAADSRIAPVTARGAEGEVSLDAVSAARQAVIQGIEPELAGIIYGVPPETATEAGFQTIKQSLQGATEGGVAAPSTDPLAGPLAERAAEIALQYATGAGAGRGGGRGAGGGGATVEAVDPDKVLSDTERLAVQQYIQALADDGVATAEEYGDGFEEAKAAYTKAANLGEYTRAQAPYFNPEFLNRLGTVARTKTAEEEQRGRFLTREERTPAEIEREQAKLFLESEMRAQGLVYLDPADYPDVAPWRLDTVPRAMRVLRDEGADALLAELTPGIKVDPREYGRMLANMKNEKGEEVKGDEAREKAQKKFKNDERADLALDYFFATKAAQQRRGQMTRAQEKAAEAAATAAPAPAPAPAAPAPRAQRKSLWDDIEDYERRQEEARAASPPAPPPAPMAQMTMPSENIIVPRPTATSEMLAPNAGDEMVATLRSVPTPSAMVALPPKAEDALQQMAIEALLERMRAEAAARKTVR